MTTQELRELDAWIDIHLFNRSEELSKISDRYTTSQHCAMDVLKKCAENCPQIMISTYDGKWIVGNDSIDGLIKAETIELAICLFAKQLFSQTTTA